MGIKNYLQYINLEILNKYKIYENIYIDGNYLLYYLIYKCKNDNDLSNKIDNYMNYLFSMIKVTNNLYLIFDGNFDKTIINNPKELTQENRSKNKKISYDYDKQLIYPGSIIIKTFIEFMKNIIKQLQKIYKLKFNLIINDDSIDGEADIKILDLIYNSNQNNILIVSKDTDMILIGYSLIICKNINIDILSNLKPISLININKLSKLKHIIFNYKNSIIYSYNSDYILLVLFLGNDYLPKISNVNHNLIFECYFTYLKFGYDQIIQNNIIIYDNLINFFDIIIKIKKIKFNINKINYKQFLIYYNNLNWCLKYYKLLNNDLNYISNINNKKIINIFNFINYIII